MGAPLLYIGNNSRIERPRNTKIGTQVAHVTSDSDTTFKVRRSKVKVTGAGHIVAASRSQLVFTESTCCRVAVVQYIGQPPSLLRFVR